MFKALESCRGTPRREAILSQEVDQDFEVLLRTQAPRGRGGHVRRDEIVELAHSSIAGPGARKPRTFERRGPDLRVSRQVRSVADRTVGLEDLSSGLHLLFGK